MLLRKVLGEYTRTNLRRSTKRMVTQTAAYTEIGIRVVKKVANEGELVPCVARNGDTEVELSLAEPTLGSLLVFCQGRQLCVRLSAPQLRVPSGISIASQADKGMESNLQGPSSGTAQSPRGWHRSLL
jgi:hypothetical protein